MVLKKYSKAFSEHENIGDLKVQIMAQVKGRGMLPLVYRKRI